MSRYPPYSANQSSAKVQQHYKSGPWSHEGKMDINLIGRQALADHTVTNASSSSHLNLNIFCPKTGAGDGATCRDVASLLGQSSNFHPFDVQVGGLRKLGRKVGCSRGLHPTRASVSPMPDFGMPVRKTETTAAVVRRAGTIRCSRGLLSVCGPMRGKHRHGLRFPSSPVEVTVPGARRRTGLQRRW